MPTQLIATLLGSTCCMRLASVAICCHILAVISSSWKMVKFESTTPNMHVAAGSPNARDMLRSTMLRYVALAYCDCLAGALQKCKNKGKVQLGDPKSGRGRLWERLLRGAFHYKVSRVFFTVTLWHSVKVRFIYHTLYIFQAARR